MDGRDDSGPPSQRTHLRMYLLFIIIILQEEGAMQTNRLLDG